MARFKFSLFFPITTEDNTLPFGHLEVQRFIPVAYFNCDRLEAVFSLSNSFDVPWASGKNSKVMIGLRSASVGDLILDNETDDLWLIDRVGFGKVSADKYHFMQFGIAR